MKRAELFIGLACVLVVVVSLGVGVAGVLRNPMEDRLPSFELDLAAIVYVPEEYKTDSDVDYGAIVLGIVGKPALWKELVPPPARIAPPPKAPKAPNFAKLLQNVAASARQELIDSEGRTLIQVKTPENHGGDWLGVGDKVRGVTIKEITGKAVVFSLISNDKEYTYSLPRR